MPTVLVTDFTFDRPPVDEALVTPGIRPDDRGQDGDRAVGGGARTDRRLKRVEKYIVARANLVGVESFDDGRRRRGLDIRDDIGSLTWILRLRSSPGHARAEPDFRDLAATLPDCKARVWPDVGHLGVLRHWREVRESVAPS